MFDNAFWNSVLDTARNPIQGLFEEVGGAMGFGYEPQRDPFVPQGYQYEGRPYDAGFGSQGLFEQNPFLSWSQMSAPAPQVLQQQALTIGRGNVFANARQRGQAASPTAAPVSGAYYGGQFTYETPFQGANDPALAANVALAREAAKAFGIDEEVFLRQIWQESRFNPQARNPKSGAAGIAQFMPATAAEQGVDVNDVRSSLFGGAKYLRQQLDRYQGDYVKALAAYNAGAGNLDSNNGVPLPGENTIYVNNILAGAKRKEAQQAAQSGDPAAVAASKPLRGLTAYQYGSEALATGAADYICGPIAAQAFARFAGREPTLAESLGLARRMGIIDADKGMYGIESTAQLIRELGGKATVDNTASFQETLGELMAGRPVIINTPNHYFVIEDYDPKTGKFDFSNSVRALGSHTRTRGANGSTWYTLEEIAALGPGYNIRGAIYAR